MHREVNVVKDPSMSVMSTSMSLTECSMKVAAVVGEFLVLACKVLYVILCATVRNIMPKPKKDLNDEIVLITGSAHGVGRELAIQTAKLGAKIVLWDINEEKVKETADEIKANGGRAWSYVCDVRLEKEVNETARTVAQEVGDVTILVNNAGIMQNVPLLELDSEKIKRTFEVNTLAHFWTIRAFLPKMKENNYGHIVAIASAAGLIGHVNQSDYSASKFGVVGMMESLSEEMRLRNSNVRFTTICPLTVNTGLNHHPVSKYPLLTPILTVKDAVRQILDAIRTEEFLVTLPRSSSFLLIGSKLFPRRVMSEVMDVLEYCRISNNEPNGKEIKEKGKTESIYKQ